MDCIFDGLNDRQREAVEATEGCIKVVAGAGSGKTRVLAHRFAHLVNNLGIDPANILCTTFTNKAAQEMRTRISRMVEGGKSNDFVCTIHGFCVKVLRRDIHRLGWPASFTILDEDDSEQLSKQVLELHGLDRTKKTVKELGDAVALFKHFGCKDYISKYMLPHSPAFNDTAGFDEVQTYVHYQAMNYCLEFDDIIAFALYILDTYSEVLEYWQDTLNYIMVDEAQDCNRSDWTIATLMAGKYGNLFVVGDPDQAIYEWRGACPTDFVTWECDREIILAENYRSTPNILDVANCVISNNKNRIPKDLYTLRPATDRVMHFHARNDAEEAEWIAGRISSEVEAGTSSYSDFAVLYRASHLSRSLEQVLLREKIPYVIWGGVRFFERKEIKDALAYLRLIAGDDNLAFTRIINTPKRHFGPASLTKLKYLASEAGAGLYPTLKDKIGEWEGTKAGSSLLEFVRLIESCRELKATLSVSELLNHVLKASGLTAMLRDDPDTDRLENIDELISSIRLYETQHEGDDVTLETYLQDIALYTNADYRNDGQSVKMMTIHQSKGLEFPTVFIIGMSEGVFPSHRSLRERKQAALEEERRLMYVAVTRAEKRLYLTEAEGFNFQTRTDKYPSRFLTEIKQQFIVQEGHIDDRLWEGSKTLSRAIDNEIAPPPAGTLFPGDTVSHKYLGTGTVTEVSPDGSKIKVRFGDSASTERYIASKMLTKL